MFGLEHFGFVEIWSPIFLSVTILIAAAYLYITGPYRYKFKDSEPVRWQVKFRFLLGLFFYYLAIGGPVNLLAHLMFSAHMLSMAIAYLIVPPLILTGLPAWLVRPLIQFRWMRGLLKFMHPLITVLLFNIIFSFYHIPVIHEVIMTHYTLHTLFYIVMLIAAFMMWWQITCPVPEWKRLSELQSMAYMFANGALITPACALIIFASYPLYPTFNDPTQWAIAVGYCIPGSSAEILAAFGGPEFFTLIPAIDDQQLGGVIMKLIQEIMYGGILSYIFIHWYRKENPENDDDMNPKEEYKISGNLDLKRA